MLKESVTLHSMSVVSAFARTILAFKEAFVNVAEKQPMFGGSGQCWQMFC